MKKIVSSVLASALPRLANTRNKGRLSILIYHRVLKNVDFMSPSVPTQSQFDWQMELLARYFNPLCLDDALRLLDRNELPENGVCVTFDDGYADNLNYALPVLKKWNIPATVFVSTDYLDGGRMWNDTVIEAVKLSSQTQIDLSECGLGVYQIDSKHSRRIAATNILEKLKYLPPLKRQLSVNLLGAQSGKLPQDLMLTSEQLREMHSSGVEIGAHTCSHPILTSLDPVAARREIALSKEILEKKIGNPIYYFAYPNGVPGKDYSSVHSAIVKEEGFKAAVSTRWGVSDRSSDRFELARFTPWEKTPIRFLAKLLLNQSNLV